MLKLAVKALLEFDSSHVYSRMVNDCESRVSFKFLQLECILIIAWYLIYVLGYLMVQLFDMLNLLMRYL